MADRVVSFVFKGNISDLDTAIESIKSKLTDTEAASIRLSTSLGREGKNITKVFVETDKTVKTLSEDIKALKVSLVDALNDPSTDTGIRSVRSFSEAVKSSNKVIQEETAKTTQTLKQQAQAIAETNDARVANMRRSDQQIVDAARDYAATINGIKQRQANETLRIYQDLERNLRSIEERVAAGAITQRTGTLRSNKLISGAELQTQAVQDNSRAYQIELSQYQAHQSNMLHALQQRVALEATTVQHGANSIQAVRQAQAQQEVNIMRNLQAQMAAINSAIASGHTNATAGQASLAQAMAATEQAITTSRNATQAHVEQLQRAASGANDANYAHRNLLTTVFEFVGAYRLINFAMNTFLQGLRSIPQAGIEMQSTISALHASFSTSISNGNISSNQQLGEDLTIINMQMLQKEADRTGISITTLEKNYRSFLASAHLAGESTATVNAIFKDLNTTITALHMSGANAELTFLALSQMFNKGKIQSEELVKQLGNLLPGAFASFAAANKISTEKLVADMKAGAVSAHETIQKFISFYADTYAGAFVKASMGLNAELGRLDTAWTNFSRAMFIVTQDIMSYFVQLGTTILKALTPKEETIAKWQEYSEKIKNTFSSNADTGSMKLPDTTRFLTDVQKYDVLLTQLQTKQLELQKLRGDFGKDNLTPFSAEWWSTPIDSTEAIKKNAEDIKNAEKEVTKLAEAFANAGIKLTAVNEEMNNTGKNWDEVTTGAMAKLEARIYHGVSEYNKIVTILSSTLEKQGGQFSVDTKDKDGNIIPAKGMTEKFYMDALAEANKLLFATMDKVDKKHDSINSKLETQQQRYESIVRSAEDLLREENDRVTLLNASLSTSPDNTLTALGEKRLALATEYKTVLDQINLLKGVSVQQDSISVSKMDLLSEKSAAVKANLSAIATYPAIVEQIRSGAVAKGIDPNLAVALAAQESKFNSTAVSSGNAKGIFQLINGTAASMGVKNVFDVAQNIEGGLKYMAYVKDQVVTANDNVTEAMQKIINAYHDGPGYKGAPHSAEGIAEVKTVLSTYAAMGGEVDKTTLSITNAGNAYVVNGSKMETLIDKAKKLKKALEDTNNQIVASAANAVAGPKYQLPDVFTSSKAASKLDANSLISEEGFKAIPRLESFLVSAKTQAQALTDELNALDIRVKDADVRIKGGFNLSGQALAELVQQQKEDNKSIIEKDLLLKNLATSYSGVAEAVNKWNTERTKLQNTDTALAQEIKSLDSQIRKASLGDKGQFLENEREKLTEVNAKLYEQYGIFRDIDSQIGILAAKYDQFREAVIQKELFDSLKSSFASAISDMAKGTKSFTDIFKNLFDSAVDSILNSSIKRLQLGLENIWNGYSSGWGQVVSSVIGIGAAAIGSWLTKENTKAPVNPAIVAGKTLGSASFYQADTGARDINYAYSVEPIRAWNQSLNDAATLIRNNSETITSFLGRAADRVFGAGTTTYLSNLLDTIKKPFTSLYDYASKFGESILNKGQDILTQGTNLLTGATTALTAGFAGLAGGSVAGAWSSGVGALSTSTGSAITTSWNAGVNLQSLGSASSFAGSVQAAEAAAGTGTQTGSQLDSTTGVIRAFLTVVKLGFDLASIAGNKYLTTLEKVSASFKAAEGAVVAIPVVGWIAAAVMHGLAAITQQLSGDWVGGLSYAFGGHVGELIAGMFKKDPSFTMLSYSKWNTESTYDSSGKFFSSGGGRNQSASIGVETDFGYLDARVNDAGRVTADYVKEAFLPLLNTVKTYDAHLATSIRGIDSAYGSKDTLAIFKANAKQYEPERPLDNLNSSELVGMRFTNFIGKGLQNTGTIAGETAGLWIEVFSKKLLDETKGNNYNFAQIFNIENFIASTLPDLVKLPKKLASLFVDSVKSVADGATQDEFIKQFIDFFHGWSIASQGLASMGTDINQTVIPEYLASLVGLGFTVKESAIQLVQYAEALNTAGGYTKDTLNAIITDLLNTAKSKGYSKDQVAGYTSTALTLSKTAQELGFKDAGNSAKFLTDKLMSLTSAATETANAEIDRLITDEKLTKITRQAAIEQLVLTGKLDETKVTAADFSIELTKQTKVYLDAIGTVAHFGQILGVSLGNLGTFTDFVESSKELIDSLGGLDKATNRLSTTIKGAMGETNYLYQEMIVSQTNAAHILKKNGVTEANVDAVYLLALANKELTAAQKAEIVSQYEVIQGSRDTKAAYEANTKGLKEILVRYGLATSAGNSLNTTMNNLSKAFGSAENAASSLGNIIAFAFSEEQQGSMAKNVALGNFNTATSNVGLTGLTLDTLKGMNAWAIKQLQDPNSGIKTDTAVNYNGVSITPAQLFKFTETYGVPLDSINKSIAKDSSRNSEADDAAKKAEDNAKKFAETMEAINKDLKAFNIAPLQKTFNDLNDKINSYIKSANETGNAIDASTLTSYRNAGTKQIVDEWSKPLSDAFSKLGKSDDYASVLDITAKYGELNKQLDTIYANTNRQYFTEKNLADARSNLAKLQQAEIDKIKKATQDSIDSYTSNIAGATRGSQVSSVLDILKEFGKQVEANNSSGSLSTTEKDNNLKSIIYAAQLKVQDVFKADATEYINIGKLKRDVSINEISTWFSNSKSVLREIALAYNLTEQKALEVITTIRDVRIAALNKERESTVLNALNSYKSKGDPKFPELQQLKNSLTDVVTNATTGIVQLLNAGVDYSDIITYLGNTYRNGAEVVQSSLESIQTTFNNLEKDIANKKLSISDKILELLNPDDSKVLYNAQRARALADLQSTDLQKQLTAADTLFNLETQRYQTAISSEKSLLDAAKNIKKWIDDFKLSQLSTLSPEAKVAEARRQYTDTLTKAKTGDVTALGEVTGKANSLLEALNAYYASSSTYQTGMSEVLSQLDQLAVPASRLTAGETIISQNTKDIVTNLEALQLTYDTITKQQTNILASKIADMEQAATRIESTFRASMEKLASVYNVSAKQLEDAVSQSVNSLQQDLLARTLTSILSGLAIFDTLNVTMVDVSKSISDLSKSLASSTSTVVKPTSNTIAPTNSTDVSTSVPNTSTKAPTYTMAGVIPSNGINMNMFWELVKGGSWLEAAKYAITDNGYSKTDIANWIKGAGGSYMETLNWLTMQGFANGGNYTGGVSIVGEKGPELFASKVGGRITSNADSANMLQAGNKEVVSAIKESIAVTAYELRTLRSENADKQSAMLQKLAMLERRLSQIEGNGTLLGASS